MTMLGDSCRKYNGRVGRCKECVWNQWLVYLTCIWLAAHIWTVEGRVGSNFLHAIQNRKDRPKNTQAARKRQDRPSNYKNTQAASTQVATFGKDATPVLLIDNVLPPKQFRAMVEKMKRREDAFESNGNNFPGRLAPLDRGSVAPIVEKLLANPKVTELYTKENLALDRVQGFVSVLCSKGHVHSDMEENPYFHAPKVFATVPPAAVLYLDGGVFAQNSISSGTAFYREEGSGLERISGARNKTALCNNHPASMACSWNTSISKQMKSATYTELQYVEIFRAIGKPNRIVLYPQDMLHNAVVEEHEENILRCNPMVSVGCGIVGGGCGCCADFFFFSFEGG